MKTLRERIKEICYESAQDGEMVSVDAILQALKDCIPEEWEKRFDTLFRCQHCFYGRGDGYCAIITPDGKHKEDEWSYTKIAEPTDIKAFIRKQRQAVRDEIVEKCKKMKKKPTIDCDGYKTALNDVIECIKEDV